MSLVHLRDLVTIVRKEGIMSALKYDWRVTQLRLNNLVLYGSLAIKPWQVHDEKPLTLSEVKPDQFAYRRYCI